MPWLFTCSCNSGCHDPEEDGLALFRDPFHLSLYDLSGLYVVTDGFSPQSSPSSLSDRVRQRIQK